MTVAAYASGLQTGTIGSEIFLANINEAGVFTLHVDLANMQSLDYVELRGYQTVLNSGTARVPYMDAYQGAQPTDSNVAISVPIGNELTDPQALRFSLKQTLGTARTYPWKVLKYT